MAPVGGKLNMMMIRTCTALIAVLCASTAMTQAAQASPLPSPYSAPDWSVQLNDYTGFGLNSSSITQNTPSSLTFAYDYGIYPDPGIYSGAEVVFKTIAQATGTLSFRAIFGWSGGYYFSSNNVTVYANGPGGITQTYLGGYGFDTRSTVKVKAGYEWGFSSYFQNYDYDSTGRGNLTVSSVPEPAAWGLMIVGFGLTGATLRRRQGRMAIA